MDSSWQLYPYGHTMPPLLPGTILPAANKNQCTKCWTRLSLQLRCALFECNQLNTSQVCSSFFKMQKQPTSVSTVVGKPPASLKEAPDPMMWNDQATQICRCNVGCELSNNELTSNGVQKNPGKISTSDCLYHQGDWLSEIKQVKYSTYKVKPKKTFSAQHSRSWNGFGFRSISCQISRIELNHNKLINLNRLQQYPPKYLQ